jgi:hypothetical protein
MPSIEIFASNFFVVRHTNNTAYWIQLDSTNYIQDSKYPDSTSGNKSWYLTVDGGSPQCVAWVLADAPNSNTPLIVGSNVKIGISGWIRGGAPLQIGVFFQAQDNNFSSFSSSLVWPTQNGYVVEFQRWTDGNFYTLVRKLSGGSVSNLTYANEGAFASVHTFFWTIEVLRQGNLIRADIYKWTNSTTKTFVRTYNVSDSSFTSGRVGFYYSQGYTTGAGIVIGNTDYFWVEG